MFVALRGCTAYGVVRGTVSFSDGKYIIKVESAGGVIYDEFSFNGDRTDFWRFLGVWSCERKALAINTFGTPLFDDDFSSFRERHACGRDFVVTSDVYVFDGFQPEEFPYES